jgi:solute carrier family 25 (mitochondrial uncoupling protein), member 27
MAAAVGSPKSPFEEAFLRWAVAAVACCAAESATIPLDFLRVRRQLENELGKGGGGTAAKPLGLIAMAKNVARTEGIGAFYTGLSAACLRQAIYGGAGVGFYSTARRLFTSEDAANAPLWARVAAGALTGGVGQAIAAPTDVIKTRVQADGRKGKLTGQPPRYKGLIDAFRVIAKTEGWHGFFQGIVPAVQRAAIINGAGIASFDHTKHLVQASLGKTEGATAIVAGSLISGLVSALVSSPFDLIRTRLANQIHGAKGNLYSGSWDCAVKTVKSEGVIALYKGFTPAYLRLAPWQLVFFFSWEEMSKFMGVPVDGSGAGKR